MERNIKYYVKKFIICTTRNTNKPIKPANKQILSYYPMERVEKDLIKLGKINFENDND